MVKGNGHVHGEAAGNGNGLPDVRSKDWQFMEVIRGRVTIYDFP